MQLARPRKEVEMLVLAYLLLLLLISTALTVLRIRAFRQRYHRN